MRRPVPFSPLEFDMTSQRRDCCRSAEFHLTSLSIANPSCFTNPRSKAWMGVFSSTQKTAVCWGELA